MKHRMLLYVPLCLGAVLAIQPVVSSGEEEGKKEDKGHMEGEMDPRMMEWMKYAMPGEHHQKLDPMVGDWNFEVKWRWGEEAEWEASTGKCHMEWVLDGRYVRSEIKEEKSAEAAARAGGFVFKGIGFTGYDNYHKRYTSVWMDNMSTMVMTSTGTYDESTKTFTFHGEYDDVTTGKTKKIKSTMRIEGPDKFIDKGYEIGPDGKETQTFEGTYTRA